MAAEKQVGCERVAGKKRSRNKFKQNDANTATQPSAAALQHFPEIGTSAGARSSAVEMAPRLSETQVGPSGRKIAGTPAMNGTAEMPPSKKHKKNNFKQHVEQEASVAMHTSPVEGRVLVSNGATSTPAVVDGDASSHAAAKKRSKNKFKQPRESDAAKQTSVVPAVLDLGSKFPTSNDAAVAAAAPAEVASGQRAARKRSKNKFKSQDSSPALAQTTLTAEGLQSTAATQGNGTTSGQAGARTNMQPLQVCDVQASGGVPTRGPTGQAGQRSGHPGASDVKGAAADRGQPPRDVPVDGNIRHAGPASEGVPAVSQKWHAGGRSGGPEAAGPMKQRTSDQRAAQKRGPDPAVLPDDAAGESRKKRRRKSKGAVAQPEFGASADGGAHSGLGEGGAAKSVQLLTVVTPPPKGAAGSANWTALKAVIGAGSGRKRKRPGPEAEIGNAAAQERRPERMSDMEGLTPVLAVDCEMVGVGADGTRSSLARVCVVNSAGNVLLDEHVAQKERVTDYRTRFSGIRPRDLAGAPSLEEVQQRVADMFKGRTVVGHAITNDLTALLLSHPRKMVRDTARYPPLMRATAPGRRPKPRALRQLALEHLGLTIQEGEHSPVDDARAALYLYQKHRKEWEMHIERGTISQLKAPDGGQQQPGRKKGTKTLEELAAADDMVDL